jgi:glutamine amidotransferase
MITIIDYGLGNIKAFANVYKYLDIPVRFARNAADLMSASKIILPGVGAFDHAMSSLKKSGMRQALDHLVLEKLVPVLGICVGMQILASSSEEGGLPGLGWIDGVVKKIEFSNLDKNEPLPHMGWNSIKLLNDKHPLLHGIEQIPYFYFLHSYYFACNQTSNVLATTHYGNDFSVIINKNNIYGIQCHPEKSHQAGITFLENFANL